jgi:hypothetical protein
VRSLGAAYERAKMKLSSDSDDGNTGGDHGTKDVIRFSFHRSGGDGSGVCVYLYSYVCC